MMKTIFGGVRAWANTLSTPAASASEPSAVVRSTSRRETFFWGSLCGIAREYTTRGRGAGGPAAELSNNHKMWGEGFPAAPTYCCLQLDDLLLSRDPPYPELKPDGVRSGRDGPSRGRSARCERSR